MRPNLIFDLGMHEGHDTEFYLKKGFDVVAVEANPAMAQNGRKRFADAIAGGRLTIVEAAIYEKPGTISFFINETVSDWSSAYTNFGARPGTDFKEIQVEAIRFREVLERFGCPHYIKIDIEGADALVFEDLALFGDRPHYISAEFGPYELALAAFNLGYRRFKLVNQDSNRFSTLPNPPLEGQYCEHSFNGLMSGPFGNEAPGSWMTIAELSNIYLSFTAIRTGSPHLFPNAWFDFHAGL
jgi:FkbM family methyltransferase